MSFLSFNYKILILVNQIKRINKQTKYLNINKIVNKESLKRFEDVGKYIYVCSKFDWWDKKLRCKYFFLSGIFFLKNQFFLIFKKGYGRIILAVISCCLMSTNYVLASWCYVTSALLDAVDGHAARHFNQSKKISFFLLI